MATQTIDRDEAIRRIRAALKKRSGRAWSVTGGRGTAWGWLRIMSPPARRVDGWKMSEQDRAELAQLLGLETVHPQGEQVPASSAYYAEYVERAETGASNVNAQPYWD